MVRSRVAAYGEFICKLALSCANSKCGRARSYIPAGVYPVPERQASHRIANSGPAGVIPKVKGGSKTTGRKHKLNVLSLENANRKGDTVWVVEATIVQGMWQML